MDLKTYHRIRDGAAQDRARAAFADITLRVTIGAIGLLAIAAIIAVARLL